MKRAKAAQKILYEKFSTAIYLISAKDDPSLHTDKANEVINNSGKLLDSLFSIKRPKIILKQNY
jgi:hypothetical protein